MSTIRVHCDEAYVSILDTSQVLLLPRGHVEESDEISDDVRDDIFTHVNQISSLFEIKAKATRQGALL
jgi:hypothetical protein